MSTVSSEPETEHLIGLYEEHHSRDLSQCICDLDCVCIKDSKTSSTISSTQTQQRLKAPYQHTRNISKTIDWTERAPSLRFHFQKRSVSSPEVITEATIRETSKRSLDLTIRQAAEVEAAQRFISQVDFTDIEHQTYQSSHTARRPRLGSITSARDSILANPLSIPRVRSGKMEAHTLIKRRHIVIPPALQLADSTTIIEKNRTPLPTRTSSRGAPSFDVARPLLSARSFSHTIVSPTLRSEPKTPLSILTPENAHSFQFDFSIPTEPRLSRSGSGATTDSQSPPTPIDGPTEDQIRRDIENFAQEHGPFLRGSNRRTRKPARMDGAEYRQEQRQSESASPQSTQVEESRECGRSVFSNGEGMSIPQDSEPDTSPNMRRNNNIFSWLQKKPECEPEVEFEVDDLLDLYLTDEQRDDADVVRHKISGEGLRDVRHRTGTDLFSTTNG